MSAGEPGEPGGVRHGEALSGAAVPISTTEAAELMRPLAEFGALLLAVSGGADSMALLHLAAWWRDGSVGGRAACAPRLAAVTVDHRLRAGTADEALMVAQAAHRLGIPHQVAVWEGGPAARERGGLQDAARAARYALLRQAAEAMGERPVAIVTAHSEDDQAETFVMRLRRGSGLDGLAGIPALRPLDVATEVMLARPLLEVPKARLVATLQAAGAAWAEDPSNQDDTYERVRVRRSLAALAVEGTRAAAIGASVRRLRRARQALEQITAELLARAAVIHGGAYASVERAAIRAVPEEVRIRAVAALVAAFGGAGGPARLDQVEAFAERVVAEDFRGETIGGAVVQPSPGGAGTILVYREEGRNSLGVLELEPGGQAVWDRRYRVSLGPGAAGPLTVSALGAADGRALRTDWPHLRAIPAAAAATLPAFRDGAGGLVAVPAPGSAGQGWGSPALGARAELLLPAALAASVRAE